MSEDRKNFFRHPSPNFNSRATGAQIRYIVLHYTGMPTAEAALARLRDPAAEVSAHYLIDESGHVIQLVDEADRAWHAGKSFWRGVTDINSVSIGIELANPGHEFGYRPFPAEQIAALKELLHDIMRRYGLPPSSILAHSDIAPQRKSDPGELFPWRELAAEGLGVCFSADDHGTDQSGGVPSPLRGGLGRGVTRKCKTLKLCSNHISPLPSPPRKGEGTPPLWSVGQFIWASELLRTIGYHCPPDDQQAIRAALLAFQRRYNPSCLTGTPDDETMSRLRAIACLSAPFSSGERE